MNRWLIGSICALSIILIILGYTVVPGLLKVSHVRGVANKQMELIEDGLKDGKSLVEVRGTAQANLTEEMAGNTETEFAIYKLNFDEKKRTYRIDVQFAYDKKFESFSTKEKKY